MGASGNKLFDDDTACDVRDEYVRLLGEGHAGPAATALLLEGWKETVSDADEGPVFWLALAATQHKYGRLEPRVKKEALAVLNRQAGLDRWREIGAHAVRGRLKQLEKVRTQILSPQPKEKRVAPPFKDTCAWKTGEVIAYRLKSGEEVLLAVLGTETHAKGVSPVCELLDWRGSEGRGPEGAGAGAEIAKAGVCEGKLPPETLLSALATLYPEHATNPVRARQLLLADMGLAKPPAEDLLFDLAQVGAVTEAIHKLKTGDRKVTEKVLRFARERKPELVKPVTQFSLRRELKKSEMPAKRVKRLTVRRENVQKLGDWLVIRWYELDEALGGVFGVGVSDSPQRHGDTEKKGKGWKGGKSRSDLEWDNP